jgi:hypothetical protein
VPAAAHQSATAAARLRGRASGLRSAASVGFQAGPSPFLERHPGAAGSSRGRDGGLLDASRRRAKAPQEGAWRQSRGSGRDALDGMGDAADSLDLVKRQAQDGRRRRLVIGAVSSDRTAARRIGVLGDPRRRVVPTRTNDAQTYQTRPLRLREPTSKRRRRFHRVEARSVASARSRHASQGST